MADYCREQHAVQKDIGERFGLSWDHFGRSSSPQNHELTQHFAARLDAEGYLEERVTKQVYSPVDGRFLPDRYIVGTCPYCGYENARGDQCENCTRVLDPTDLLEPRSALSGSTDLEVRETKHLFLLQSKLVDEVRDWVEAHADVWPALTLSIARKWLDEGLRDRGITRDLDWGVPVIDRPGFEDKVYYVWFDAPIEYLGATAEWADAGEGRDWRSWWYDADDVEYTQFMAKDNVPFHTVSFPVTLIGSREPWTQGPPDQGLQLAHLLRRQVLHEPGPRRVHGPGARHLPRRLLALVPVRQRARVERLELHVGAVRRRGEQGPGRLVRQPREPLPHAVRQALRRRWCPPVASPASARRSSPPTSPRWWPPTPS